MFKNQLFYSKNHLKFHKRHNCLKLSKYNHATFSTSFSTAQVKKKKHSKLNIIKQIAKNLSRLLFLIYSYKESFNR